jgi:hypothetical protein
MTRKGKTVVRTQQLGSSPRIRTHRHSFTYLCGSSTVFADVSIRASLMKRTLLRTPIAPHTSSSAGFCCFPVSCNGNYPSTRCIRFYWTESPTQMQVQHHQDLYKHYGFQPKLHGPVWCPITKCFGPYESRRAAHLVPYKIGIEPAISKLQQDQAICRILLLGETIKNF